MGRGGRQRRLEPSQGGIFRGNGLKVMEVLSNIDVSEFTSGTTGSSGSVGSGAARAPQDLPSTRAGGQDDVS